MSKALNKKKQIEYSQKSIYEDMTVQESEMMWYTKDEIEELIVSEMVGTSFNGLPLRTRSKEAKVLVCTSLGYPVPKSFKKTQPRFPSQNLDTYVQKSNNLQVWNEELDPERRYLLIRLDENDVVTAAKVVTGDDLAILDTTGTLTQKYQARLITGDDTTELISSKDTAELIGGVNLQTSADLKNLSPIEAPQDQSILEINTIYNLLKPLVGESFKDAGKDQERNRGADLHKLVCKALGYSNYADDGQFPDLKNQLLEVKLQTSQTIDLGLVCPDSDHNLDMNPVSGLRVRHKDVRYALFYGKIEDDIVVLTNFYLTTGEDFFQRFQQFQGKVLNKKLQIPLPKDFFE